MKMLCICRKRGTRAILWKNLQKTKTKTVPCDRTPSQRQWAEFMIPCSTAPATTDTLRTAGKSPPPPGWSSETMGFPLRRRISSLTLEWLRRCYRAHGLQRHRAVAANDSGTGQWAKGWSAWWEWRKGTERQAHRQRQRDGGKQTEAARVGVMV